MTKRILTNRTRAAVMFAMIMGMAAPLQAAWEDYDNFDGLPNNSPPDSKLWKVSGDPVANVFIDKKRLMIDFLVSQAGTVAVELIRKQATIRGVRMDVTFEGQCRNKEALVAGAVIGRKPGNKFGASFLALFARETPQIQGFAFLLDKSGTPPPLFDPVSATKKLLKKTVPATMSWNRKRVRYIVAKKLDEKKRSQISLKNPKKSEASVAITAGRPVGLDKACRIAIDNVEVKRAN